jgi:hypothetical protein
VQTVIDGQLPRTADGSIAYDLYVGLMGRRIGTPVAGVASGTLHEFNEAKASFEQSGKPHILFYFRKEQSGDGAEDAQLQGVRAFREQYPGLFSSFHSIADLEMQFRRHLLAELLDLVVVAEAKPATAGEAWSRSLIERYAQMHATSGRFLDDSPEKPQRIMRYLQELLGINYQLSGRELQVLFGALYCSLLETDDEEPIHKLLDTPEIANQVTTLVRTARASSPAALYAGADLRLDLLAALLKIGLRLDLNRKGIRSNVTSLPDVRHSPVEEWLAYLTTEIACQRGVVRFHLLVPDERWIAPLVGATVVAMEGLWQQVRPVLTQHGVSYAVGRPRIEVASDLAWLPEALLDRVQSAAVEAASSLPKFPHFGRADLPTVADLLPLPISKVRGLETFYYETGGSLRLLVNGTVVAERAAGASGNIEYLPSGDQAAECILEANEVGVFVPVTCCMLQRLNPIEEGVLDSSQDRSEAVRSLGLWNDLLRMIWPRITESGGDSSDLMDAFHILGNALESASQGNNSLLERRDHYWDAINIVRNRIEQKKVTL